MPDASNLLAFALVAFGMVLTPGPNMAYLISRSIAALLIRRPSFAAVQRWIMGTVLAGLAVRMATEARR